MYVICDLCASQLLEYDFNLYKLWTDICHQQNIHNENAVYEHKFLSHHKDLYENLEYLEKHQFIVTHEDQYGIKIKPIGCETFSKILGTNIRKYCCDEVFHLEID